MTRTTALLCLATGLAGTLPALAAPPANNNFSARIEPVPGKPDSAVDLQAWSEDQSPDADGHYNRRFRVTVAAGGLVERAGPADFGAPAVAPAF